MEPLTIWCEKCGLIASGEPLLEGKTLAEVEEKIKWLRNKIEIGKFPDVIGGHIGFSCPNCNDHLILFHEERWKENKWRLNIRMTQEKAPNCLIDPVLNKYRKIITAGKN